MENWPSLRRCGVKRKRSRWMDICEEGALEPQEMLSQKLYWIKLIVRSCECHFCVVASILLNPIGG